MEKLIILLGVISLPGVVGQNSAVFKNSNSDIYNHKVVFSDQKPALDYQNPHKLKLLIDIRDFSQSPNLNNEKTKRRRGRVQKRKEKCSALSREKSRLQKPSYDLVSQNVRNKEKVTLVRNKTIEILKNGLKILNPSESYPQNEYATTFRINNTLLEKILLSSSSKQDILLSATGAYKLHIGRGAYSKQLTDNHTLVPLPENNFKQQHLKQRGEIQNNSNFDEYEYDFLADVQTNSTNTGKKFYKTVSLDQNIEGALEKIVNALKNLTNCQNKSCYQEGKAIEDSCQKWLNCREGLHRVFAIDNDLPSCPCTYPSSIFYEETVWDNKNKKYFRWRDASSESERLDIYKPGASYCIRSLLTQGSLSVSSQQCCYDRNLRLLTRGSGAGTVNFISPDVSRKLHHTVDILPWRLCKGDFTRYNKARNPNNGNNCPANPNEEEYQLQVKLSKIY